MSWVHGGWQEGVQWAGVDLYLAGMEPWWVTLGAMVGLGNGVRCWVLLQGARRWVGNKGSGSQ